MRVYAWLIDFAHFRENCPTGIIPEWMQKVTQQNGIIQYFSPYRQSRQGGKRPCTVEESRRTEDLESPLALLPHPRLLIAARQISWEIPGKNLKPRKKFIKMKKIFFVFWAENFSGFTGKCESPIVAGHVGVVGVSLRESWQNKGFQCCCCGFMEKRGCKPLCCA